MHIGDTDTQYDVAHARAICSSPTGVIQKRWIAQNPPNYRGTENSIGLSLSLTSTQKLIRVLTQSEHDALTSTTCLKNCANLFLSELCQISTNFDKFLQRDDKEVNLCKMRSLSTSSNSRHHTTVLNADVPNCYTTLKVVICSKLSNDLISTQ